MNGSVVSAYIIGLVVFLVLMLVSVIIANSISYELGANPKDKAKRRMWFWIICALVPICVFAINYFAGYQGIKVPSKAAAYMTAMSISTGIATVLYIVCGVVLSKIFNHGKLSSWF